MEERPLNFLYQGSIFRNMLTKDDLVQIKKIVDPIKKDVAQTRKDVKVLIAYFDREYVDLRKRVERIEDHLGISDKN